MRWGLIMVLGAGVAQAVELDGCAWEGIALRGKVQVVDSFPDIKVQVVESFPDFRVQFVESFPGRE